MTTAPARARRTTHVDLEQRPILVALGNVREQTVAELYREHPLMRDIRAARFSGRCEYADLCGGSRARAYASSGDPLGEDPACSFVPA